MRNGSGVYNAPASSWSPAVNGALASYTDWNSLLADISAALTQSLSADGQTPVSGNLNMNGNKLTNLAAGTGTGQSLRWEQLFSQGTEVAIASSSTVDIGAQNTSFLNVTGTTSITSFGTNYNGPRFLRFSGALTLTNSSTLILPGSANITTAAGDTCIAIPKATGGTADGWVVVAYQKNVAPGSIADASVTQAKLAPNVAGNGPAFSAYQSSAQTISTTTLTALSADTEDFDTASCFNNTGSTAGGIPAYSFLPTVAGYYQVSGQVTFGSGVSGLVFSAIYKNGARFLDGSFVYYASATGDVAASAVSGIIYLNGSTDYITLYANQSSGSSKTTFVGTRASRFQANLVRAA